MQSAGRKSGKARRDDMIMSAEDAARLGLENGDRITLRNELGEYQGRVKVGRIKPGCLQAHWPEMNILIPAGRIRAAFPITTRPWKW
jgi:anaerobic selenocysteine-containing dehydrogenase